jgi:regulatory protein
LFYGGGRPAELGGTVAGTITALKFQKNNPERVNVFLDGKSAFALMATEAARLHKGQRLSDEEIATWVAQDTRQQAYDRALRFLSYRPRSQSEVERHLRTKRVDDEVIAAVMERLQQAGYLDDQTFARFWVENRQQFRPRSQRALEYELRQKGVNRQVIADAVTDLDDETVAWQAVEGQLQRWTNLDDDELRQKITGFLGRRGFNYDTINRIYKKAYQQIRSDPTNP